MNRFLIAVLVLAANCILAGADEPKGRTNSIGIRLVAVPAGEFIMGNSEAPPKSRDQWSERDWDESPAHKVKITKPFLMGATEVTNKQYEEFDPEHVQRRGLHNVCKGDDDPVVMVTWDQAVNFCKWLSKKEGDSYRLPTEAEWEYACRAGTTSRYNTGEKLTADQANFGVDAAGKRIGPQKVGSYPANAWGLFDMHGNVAEWCQDWHGPYDAAEQTDPVGRAEGWAKVVRGWSYRHASHKFGAARYCSSSGRSGFLPGDWNHVTGFRVVCGEMPNTRPLPAAEPPVHQQNVRQGQPPKEDRDASKPYFEDLTTDLRMPRDQWGPIYSAWNHFSAITVCPNGDILAAWYTTVSEEGPECSQAAIRFRAVTGKWDPPAFFFGTPDCNTHAPVLLSDGKRIYHFCTQSLAGWDDAAECLRTSDDNGATWSQPRIILRREDKRRMSQPCSAFVAKDGKIVLAVDGDFGHRDERIMLSDDRGESWRVAGGDLIKAAGKYAIHPAAVQRDDGAFLTFMRGPHPMPAFVSKDEGETWEPQVTPFPGIGTGQKAAALKLHSGALLVCSFDNRRELLHTSPNEVAGTFAAVSFDDGKTWSHLRQVKGPKGYMSLAQGQNGIIYLLGSSKADPRIYCVAFNEAWLKEGSAIK
jgi:formylglycine-generating enzyme required for sulfatase activity